MMKAFIVNANDDLAWRVFPDLVKRVRSFLSRYEPKTNADELIADLERAFLGRSPELFGIVGFDENGTIVAHALLRLEKYYGRSALCVMQVERDRGSVVQDGFREAFLRILDRLAESLGAPEVRVLALTHAHERYYKKLGWETERILMVHPVGGNDGDVQD